MDSKKDEYERIHTPEKELSSVVIHAGEMNDVTLLKDYLQMTKLTGELNVNEPDSKGFTPLHFAVATKKLDIVKALVELGANANHRSSMGFTPLAWATGQYANVLIASYLIEKGRASVHVTSNTGACALHGAVQHGHLECISLLLKHGADARCADHNGVTPVDLAKDDDSKQLLKKALQHLSLAEDSATGIDGCEQCGVREVVLKRCSRCFISKYCSRDCQSDHWKSVHRSKCIGYVVGRPSSNQGIMTLLNLNKYPMKMTTRGPSSSTKAVPGDVVKKKFVVKVQLPITAGGPDIEQCNGGAMCYNEDRTVMGFVPPSEKGYENLRATIAKEGYMGVKAFFWAEVNMDAMDGSFRVFHGRCAPYQSW